MAERKRVYLEERDGILGKECSKCSEWKALEEYSKYHKGTGGRQPKCKVCESVYRKENKERRTEYNRNWCEANKDRHAEYRRNWREENRDRHNEAMRNWQQNNPNKIALNDQRRRARKASLPADFTAEQMKSTLDFFGGCALTGATDDVHWDHVIPTASGHGGTTFGNMIPLGGRLNESKNDSNIFEWFEANRQRFELSQARFDNLIDYLASANALTVDEYRDFVYWCHANKREVDEIKRDQRHSIEIWREAVGKQFPLPSYVMSAEDIIESEAV